MKIQTLLLSLAMAGLAIAQTTPLPAPAGTPGGFEELPEFQASEILRATYLYGQYYKVREEVFTYAGTNRFTIDSHFGVFDAEGNEMLVRRVNEVNAIAKLKEVSRTDEFKDALIKAAKSPIAAAKHIVTDPVNAVKSVPKGITKFMHRAGETIQGIGRKQGSDDPDGSKLQSIIGFTEVKRKEAIALGVDPYSSNAVLQKELDGIAWAKYAGGATLKVATMPIGGAVGIALTTTNVSSSLDDILREKSPDDLRILNRKALIAMGATESEANRLLDNDAFSPTAQTAFTLNLKSLDGVANRRAFIKLAGQISSSEPDAIFCVQTAALMSRLHTDKLPLAKIALIGDFPICIAKDGTVVVALQWDYAAWTAPAARFVDDLLKQTKSGSPKYLVAITGVVSPLLRQQLESRGFQVEDRLSPGPLK